MTDKFDIFLSNLDLLIQESEHTLNEIEKVVFTQRYKLSKAHSAIFSVQTIAMAYSIWEGFIQKTFSSYLSTLNTLNIPFIDYQDSLIIFHMESTFKQFKQYPEKVSGKARFFSDLRTHLKSADISLHTTVNTESNVGFKVLNKIMEQFSLEKFPERWGEKYNYPNKTLAEQMETFLNYRNGVAHGGDLSSSEKVTQEVFNRYKKLIIDLMYGVREKLSKGIEEEHYLKKEKPTC